MAVSALLFLLVTAPLMRGGNRNVALIVIEGAALVFLAALLSRPTRPGPGLGLRNALLAVLTLSPLWLALIYLLPLPPSLWEAAAGRADYAQLLAGVDLQPSPWRPLSLVPEATTVSLLAGIPVAAAFLAGRMADLQRLKLFLRVFVALAFAEILFGLLQLAGGAGSALHFGNDWGSTRVSGTFANPNHFANYVGMALAGYIWLAWMNLQERRRHPGAFADHPLGERRMLAVWSAGAVLLLVGVLMSNSRGAALSAVPASVIALALTLTVGTGSRPLRRPLLVVAGLVAAAIGLVGFDAIFSRFDLARMAGDASFRTLLATSTLEGAAHFWPFGAGWGTYHDVYLRFQPASVIGTADYAHQDYAQMLFEGGIFAALLMAVFAWLAITRAVELVRMVLVDRRLRREAMASAICGLGLLGFLVHSLVEFNMHIPANAIAAALLAGAYLRPLPAHDRREGTHHD